VALTVHDAETLSRCIAVGGIAVFPADTVYGLACDPDAEAAVQRLYGLKGRRPDKPAAVLFFRRELALAALPELGRRTRAALERLLPGGVTVLLPNPTRRFPLACGPDPDTLGLRVPALADALAPLHAMAWPVLQTSAAANERQVAIHSGQDGNAGTWGGCATATFKIPVWSSASPIRASSRLPAYSKYLSSAAFSLCSRSPCSITLCASCCALD